VSTPAIRATSPHRKQVCVDDVHKLHSSPSKSWGGPWPKQLQFIPRNTDGADTPVLSYRWPFSALGEVPSAKDLEIKQDQRRQTSGVVVQKRMNTTLLREKVTLTFGKGALLLRVYSLSKNRMGVLSRSVRNESSQGGPDGKRWSRGMSRRDQMVCGRCGLKRHWRRRDCLHHVAGEPNT